MATVKLDPAKGIQIPNLTTTERNAISSPETGAIIWNTTTSEINQYNGSAWEITYTPVAGISSSADATAITIDSNENVGIGDTTPTNAKLSIDNVLSGDAALAIKQDQAYYGIDINQDGNGMAFHIDTAATTQPAIEVEANALTTGKGMLISSNSADTSTRQLLRVTNDHASATGTTNLYVDNDSTGLVADFHGTGGIRSRYGIKFGTDTAAANALDDYEEGTWTVGWTSTSNTFNPSTTTGYYTKVGNLVTISYHAYLSGAPTINASANGFSFTGLPFTSSSGKSSTITWGHKRWMEWPSNTTDVMLDIEGASTTIQTLARTSIGELYNIRAVTFSRNGSGISFAGHYYTDS